MLLISWGLGLYFPIHHNVFQTCILKLNFFYDFLFEVNCYGKLDLILLMYCDIEVLFIMSVINNVGQASQHVIVFFAATIITWSIKETN